MTDNNEIKGYWWCPNCKEEIGSNRVTNQEMCDTCGHPVEWIEPEGTLARIRVQVEKLRDDAEKCSETAACEDLVYKYIGGRDACKEVLKILDGES